ncbi:VCBS domain-containing protein, partial [Rhizobium leguminosarum]|uniref:VCBS domain-containing protein n=1 Tax=Rhizobium leguminosarum TaxID=384 RepID=UPI003F94DA74
YGVFHVKPNGEFTYELTDDLAAGQTFTETVQYYKISDGEGHTDACVLTLNITGTDALV